MSEIAGDWLENVERLRGGEQRREIKRLKDELTATESSVAPLRQALAEAMDTVRKERFRADSVFRALPVGSPRPIDNILTEALEQQGTAEDNYTAAIMKMRQLKAALMKLDAPPTLIVQMPHDLTVNSRPNNVVRGFREGRTPSPSRPRRPSFFRADLLAEGGRRRTRRNKKGKKRATRRR